MIKEILAPPVRKAHRGWSARLAMPALPAKLVKQVLKVPKVIKETTAPPVRREHRGWLVRLAMLALPV